MFEAMSENGKVLGYGYRIGDRFFFFGTGHTGREDLQRLFPEYNFCFLKQVHGRQVLRARPTEVPEADGHFTEAPYQALVVQSADCVPLLFSSGERVCAVHAGWRGMAQNIIAAAKEAMPGLNFVAIGPHILRQSFEVGCDVAEQLMAAAPLRDAAMVSESETSGKKYFDLKMLAHAQLKLPGLSPVECCFDTKTNSLFHSYRRGRAARERQYSFVVIAPDLR